MNKLYSLMTLAAFFLVVPICFLAASCERPIRVVETNNRTPKLLWSQSLPMVINMNDRVPDTLKRKIRLQPSDSLTGTHFYEFMVTDSLDNDLAHKEVGKPMVIIDCEGAMKVVFKYFERLNAEAQKK